MKDVRAGSVREGEGSGGGYGTRVVGDRRGRLSPDIEGLSEV